MPLAVYCAASRPSVKRERRFVTSRSFVLKPSILSVAAAKSCRTSSSMLLGGISISDWPKDNRLTRTYVNSRKVTRT
jgi:hypothetical protein